MPYTEFVDPMDPKPAPTTDASRPTGGRPLPWSVKLLLAIYSLCFTGAALNHARDIWLGGFLPYHYVPQAINVFWTSLTLLDLLAVCMLWIRPRAGLALALLI